MAEKRPSPTSFQEAEDIYAKGGPRPGDENPDAAWAVRRYCRMYTTEAVERMATVMRGGDPRLALQAATAILDRAWGKPVQQMEVGNPGDFSEMTDRELDDYIKMAAQKLANAGNILN